MKNKEIYTETSLPLYEVTELTMEEALLALSDYRHSAMHKGIMSTEALRMEKRTNLLDRRRH